MNIVSSYNEKVLHQRLRRWLQDQVILLVLLCTIGVFIPWNDVLAVSREALLGLREEVQVHPFLVGVGYVAAFIIMTSISVPGPTSLLLAVLGGWLFGLWAIPLSSFSSSFGGSLSFLTSRYFMKDSTFFRYVPGLQRFNEDRSNAPWIVLLSCRLNPLIPYFVENLYFGRTQIPLWQFWLVTLLGMLPLTVVYVMIGSQLSQMESYHGIISWQVVAGLVACSLLPLIFLKWLNS